ncbi:MAG: HDOD domain-containing protein [Clostridia bacterium]
METYIARKPIMTHSEEIAAYEVIYTQGENSLHNYADDNSAKIMVDFFNRFNKDEISFGKAVLMTLTPKIFKSDLPMYLDPKQVMIQVDKNILVNADIKKHLLEYKEKGFKLVLIDFEFNKMYLDNIVLFDMLKVDFANPDEKNLRDQIDLAKRYGIQVCAYNVNTNSDKMRVKNYDIDFMQGDSIAEMSRTETVGEVDHLQSNLLRLTAAISNETPDFDEVADIISIDVTLTFALLRIVNSAYFGLRNQIKDIKQAISMLGIKQLRQWIYLLNIGTSGEMNDEVIKISFMRANFCQELAPKVGGLKISPSEGFLLGMFSTLDLVLKIPMADALKELNIDEEMKDALINADGENLSKDMLQLCIAYEEGKWKEVERLSNKLNLVNDDVREKYMIAIEKVNETWQSFVK